MMKLEENLGYLLFRTHKALKKGFVAVLKEYDLTDRQFAVLFRLYVNEGLSAVDLVERLSSDSSTLVAVIDKLESKSLLRREDDPRDRRAKRLFLTSQAKELMPHLVMRLTDLERERRKVLSQKEIKILISTLTKLQRYYEPAEKKIFSAASARG